MSDLLKELSGFFKPPHVYFGGWDAPQRSFSDAKVIVFGVPFDGTATYRGGSEHGPWAIRDTSAKQIEMYSRPKKYNPYSDVGISDIGDFKFGKVFPGDKELIYNPPLTDKKVEKSQIEAARDRVNRAIEQLKKLEYITKRIRQHDKVPFMLGGEHIVSLWTLRGVAPEDPVLLHFDTHCDNKENFLGVKYSHTTPIYHLTHENPIIPGKNIMQIGIGQGSEDEYENAEKSGIKIYEAVDENFASLYEGKRFQEVRNDIAKFTKGRKVCITFDIDALSSSFTPFTGTPYAFGMSPVQACQMINSISPNAEIIYMDFVEVASDGKNTTEGSVASQIIIDAMLAHPSLRRRSETSK